MVESAAIKKAIPALKKTVVWLKIPVREASQKEKSDESKTGSRQKTPPLGMVGS